MLLIRWARENGDRELVQELFNLGHNQQDAKFRLRSAWRDIIGVVPDPTPRTDVIEAALMDMTYRDAMDVAWALDMLGAKGPAIDD